MNRRESASSGHTPAHMATKFNHDTILGAGEGRRRQEKAHLGDRDAVREAGVEVADYQSGSSSWNPLDKKLGEADRTLRDEHQSIRLRKGKNGH